jgi:acyl carrier protein
MATLESREEIFKDVVSILNDLLEDREYSGKFAMETSIINDLEFESIDAVVLGEALEEHYQQSLPFAEFLTEPGEMGLRDFTIGDLVGLLYQNLGRKV